MAIPDWKPPPPCPPGKHVLHPHEHARMDDGRPKPCSGRWFCMRCREWHRRAQCSLPGAPKLPASWVKA